MGHPPRVPVWLRWEQDVVYFVTICVADRQCLLANLATFDAFKAAARKLKHWKVLAGLLMPDHLHAFVISTKDRNARLGNLSAALKRWTREDLDASWQWQPGCVDRLLRNQESFREKWLHVQNNPVRAGLVKRWQDWPYRIGFEDQIE
jgi:REP element-mobilizing transposase RayT